MSYIEATPNPLKISAYTMTCVDNQAIPTTGLTTVGLTGTIYTGPNPWATTPTISTTDDRITLPAGKYFIQVRLYVARTSGGTWGCEWYVFERVGASNVKIGYEGRKWGIVHVGDPQKTATARAYIESDGTTEVGVEAFSITSQTTQNLTAWAAYAGESRIVIWRLE